MKAEVNESQIEDYRQNGFLILREFLEAAEVAELRRAVLEAIETMGRRRIAGEGADLVDGDAYFHRVYTQRLNLWRISDIVRQYVQSPALGEMLCRLEGIEAIRI